MIKTKTQFRTTLLPTIIWGLATAFFFYKNILEVSPGVMANEFMRAFHVDGAMLGNIAAAYFYAYLIMQIPIGVLIDRFGARKLTTLAIAMCAGGAYMLAHAHSIVTASAGRFVTGFGAGFAAVSCMKLTTSWFSPKRFAMMAGFMMSAAMLGSVGGVAPLANAISALGWRHTLTFIAFAGFALMILFFIIVRDNGPYLNASQTEHSTNLLSGLLKVIKNSQTWHLSWYSGLAYAPMMIFGGLWGVPYLQSAYHFSHTVAANEISLFLLALRSAAHSPVGSLTL